MFSFSSVASALGMIAANRAALLRAGGALLAAGALAGCASAAGAGGGVGGAEGADAGGGARAWRGTSGAASPPSSFSPTSSSSSSSPSSASAAAAFVTLRERQRSLGAELRASGRRKAVLWVTAPWCGPCRAIAPVFAALAAQHAGPGVAFVKIDVDENEVTAAQLGVRGVPAFFFLVDGRAVHSFAGPDSAQLRAVVEALAGEELPPLE